METEDKTKPATMGRRGAFLLAALGMVVLAGGIYGIYYQGEFWGRDIGPNGWIPREITLVFGLPAGVTVLGTLLLTWCIWASPVKTRSKHILLAALAAVTLVSSAVASRLAGETAYRLRHERRTDRQPRP